MNIDLLSKMVKEQIMDCDCVVIPGLGAFIAEFIPASFSDRGYTINPPYRRLSFRQKYDKGVNIVELYAKANQITSKQAQQIIDTYIQELRKLLENEKTIVFPELGRLRATKENNFFFIPDENIDIYPEGFALEVISLKSTVPDIELQAQTIQNTLEQSLDINKVSNQEKVPKTAIESDKAESFEPEVSIETKSQNLIEAEALPEENLETDKVQEVKEIVLTEEFEPVEEFVDIKEEVKTPVETTTKPLLEKKKSGFRIILIVILLIIFILALASLALICLAKSYPEFLDKLLYSKEELEIIYYKL